MFAVAADHPAIGGHVSAADFAQVAHVIFGSPFSPSSLLETILDERFAGLGIRRRLGMRVASILLTPYVVAQSPLLAILHGVFAQHFASFPQLKLVSCEFELPPISISMVWHERSHRLGMHTWMRGVIRVVADHVAGQLASAGSHAGIEAA